MRRRSAPAWLLPALLVAGASQAADRPQGLLWHNGFLMTNHKLGRGVHVSPLDGGAPIQILDRSEIDVAVWPDGRQLVATRFDLYKGFTDLVVMSPAAHVVYQGRMNGYVRDVLPSPADRRLALVRQGENSLAPFEEYILDLQALKPLRRISDDDQFSWMPDGRFMLISIKTGRMRIASLDSAQETEMGQLVLPRDRAMGAFSISPTGKQFVMRMPRRNAVPAESDLWIGNIDGSGFEQLTEAKAVTNAVWSPDGRYLAYKVDTGRFCSTAGYCVGTCDQYYTPVGLRRVKGLNGQPGSATFEVRNREGKVERLGCSVLAWTP